MDAETKSPPKSLSERVLRVFADVKHEEIITAALMTGAVFLLMTAYYFLKDVREAFILDRKGGAELKSYASAAMAGILLVVSRSYDALVQRFARWRLMAIMTAVYMACLAAFASARPLGVDIGIPFFLFVGVFNVTAIAQFWSFANDIYTPAQGKRLFAIIGTGSSLGAVVGAYVPPWLSKTLGLTAMFFVAAGLLAACLAVLWVVDLRERSRADEAHEAPPALLTSKSGAGAWGLLLRDRYLLLIAGLMVIYNCVNSNGEYILDHVLHEQLVRQGIENSEAAKHAILEFKGRYFGYVNLIGLALQAFATSRVFKYVGVRGALFVMPVFSLLGYTAMAFFPLLWVIGVAKTAENSIDYSIQTTARHALYLVTSRRAKFSVKTLLDTFFQRFGDVCSAGLVYAGTHYLRLSTKGFIFVNIALVLGWFAVITALAREHKKREADQDTPAGANRLTSPSLA